MTLKTCDKSGCYPIEQIRGKIGAGEYYDVIVSHPTGGGWVKDPKQFGIPAWNGDCGDNDPANCVEMHDGIANDFRICCKTCGKATNWGANDIPGMPGAGADYTRKKWNEDITNGSSRTSIDRRYR